MSPPRLAGPAGGRRCLVTGASGFIGGHLARRLVQDGWRVRCLARPTSQVAPLERLGVEIVLGDLQSPSSLRAAVEQCEVVFHCAAMVSDWATVREIAAVNVTGTENVVGAAVEGGVRRFVHLSTTDVYGRRGPGIGLEEHAPSGRFCNWYAQTKLIAEGVVRRAGSERGLPAVILRPATVYGPGSKEVVGEIARALRAGNMVLIGGGRAVAGLVYVENLADAVVLAAVDDAAIGQTLNVTDGLEVTWRQFVDDLARGLDCPPARWSLPLPVARGLAWTLEHGYRLLRRATGVKMRPLLSRQAVHVLGNPQRFGSQRIRATLGWEPRVGYAEGLQATLRWLQGQPGDEWVGPGALRGEPSAR